MKRTTIIIATVALVVTIASVAGIAAAAPPTTTTTTTTTLPPPPPTRGVVQCVDAGNSSWSDWITMGAHTTISFNGSIASGAPAYPSVGISFSVDGVNPLANPDFTATYGMQAAPPVDFKSAWPYVRVRCQNPYNGTPVIVWMLN